MNEASIDERKSVRGGSSGMCASFLFSEAWRRKKSL